MTLSEKLKNARISHKITQKTLAEKLGISRATLSLWETGKAVPSIAHILQYQKIFNFEKGYFDDAVKEPAKNDFIYFNISRLNEAGLSKLENFYNSLLNSEEYLKNP